MIKFARLGPSSLHTGKYHFENWLQNWGGSIMIEYELQNYLAGTGWCFTDWLCPHRWFDMGSMAPDAICR